jgi:hypothetical protein
MHPPAEDLLVEPGGACEGALGPPGQGGRRAIPGISSLDIPLGVIRFSLLPSAALWREEEGKEETR